MLLKDVQHEVDEYKRVSTRIISSYPAVIQKLTKFIVNHNGNTETNLSKALNSAQLFELATILLQPIDNKTTSYKTVSNIAQKLGGLKNLTELQIRHKFDQNSLEIMEFFGQHEKKFGRFFEEITCYVKKCILNNDIINIKRLRDYVNQINNNTDAILDSRYLIALKLAQMNVNIDPNCISSFPPEIVEDFSKITVLLQEKLSASVGADEINSLLNLVQGLDRNSSEACANVKEKFAKILKALIDFADTLKKDGQKLNTDSFDCLVNSTDFLTTAMLPLIFIIPDSAILKIIHKENTINGLFSDSLIKILGHCYEVGLLNCLNVETTIYPGQKVETTFAGLLGKLINTDEAKHQEILTKINQLPNEQKFESSEVIKIFEKILSNSTSIREDSNNFNFSIFAPPKLSTQSSEKTSPGPG